MSQFIWLVLSLFIIEGSQDRNSNRAGTWRQELMQRPWSSAAHWLAPCGLVRLFSYRKQDHQTRDSTTHNELDPPHKKMTYSWILQRCFSQWSLSVQITLACVKTWVASTDAQWFFISTLFFTALFPCLGVPGTFTEQFLAFCSQLRGAIELTEPYTSEYPRWQALCIRVLETSTFMVKS